MPDKFEVKMLHVVMLGAAGGLLAWLFGLWLRHPPHINLPADAVISILLGAGAGFILIYFLVNPDRSDAPRLCAIALVGGFAWEPVWEGGRALVLMQQEQQRVNQVEAATNRAVQISQAIDTAPPAVRDSLASELDAEVTRVVTATQGMRTRAGVEQAQGSASRLRSTLATREASDPRIHEIFARTDSIGIASLDWLGSPTVASAMGTGTTATPEKLSPSDLPSDPDIHELSAGAVDSVSASAGPVRWFRLRVPQSQLVTIRAESEGDLVAALYEAEARTRVADDDDSGNNWDPLIRTRLPAGTYLLRISEYENGRLPAFRVSWSGGE